MQEQILDLSKVHWQHRHGDLTVYGTWIKLAGRWRPCMVLIRTGEERSPHTVPCIITVDKAWIWSEEVGDPAAAVTMAVEFSELLRLSHTRVNDVFRVASIIRDHLDDMLKIPPRPVEEEKPFAELTMTNRNTGKSRDILLTESS